MIMINLRTAIPLCCAVVFIAVVCSISYLALNQIRKDTAKNVRDSLQTVLQTVSKAHDIWIRQRRENTRTLVESHKVIELAEKLIELHNVGTSTIGTEALMNIREFMAPILELHGDKGFFVIAPTRVSIASTRDINIGTVNLIEKEKKRLLDRAFSGIDVFVPTIRSDVPLNSASDVTREVVPTMFIASPIRNLKNEIIAVFALRIDPNSNFSKIAQLGRIGETGETYAFDKEGVLITDSRFDHHLRMTNVVNPGQSGILNIRITDPGGNLLKGYKAPKPNWDLPLTFMASSATSGQSSFNVSGYRDYRGVRVFGAWTWEAGYEFGITTEIDESEALQPYYKTRDTFLTVVVVTSVLAMVMVYVMLRIQNESNKKLRIAHHNLEDRVKTRTSELEAAKSELSEANKRLVKLAITDGLTSLYNRKYFDEQLNLEWHRCLRSHNPLSIILFDIDYFKQYNDHYGHVKGDECLKIISFELKKLRIVKRPGDLVARYGGEEFVVMLSNADEAYTRKVAETIRTSINELNILHEYSNVKDVDHVTVSLGYATEVHLDLVQPKLLIEQADKALYQAKASGRNIAIEYNEKNMGRIVNINSRKEY